MSNKLPIARIVTGAVIGIASYLVFIPVGNLRSSEFVLLYIPWIIQLVLEAPLRLVFVILLGTDIVHGQVMQIVIPALASLSFGLLGSILASGQRKIIINGLISLGIFFYLSCFFGTLLTLMAV
ncbi:MAG: hypothetical protein JNK32_04450 [Anaerolineales bacterium]|nr:hypothetical protein [Anaerolineales bacterium]